jgi:hypothetical protein
LRRFVVCGRQELSRVVELVPDGKCDGYWGGRVAGKIFDGGVAKFEKNVGETLNGSGSEWRERWLVMLMRL